MLRLHQIQHPLGQRFPEIRSVHGAHVLHGLLHDLATDGRIKRLKALLKPFKANGVIYHTLRYCDPYTFKAKETKDILEKEGIPLLELHTEYAGSDIEAIRTRVEAFIEMIKLKAETGVAA